MQKLLQILILIGGIFLLNQSSHSAPMTSAGFELRYSGTTNGGEPVASSSFKLRGAVRSEDGATSQGTSYKVRGGVWQLPVFFGDLDNDNAVTVADALRTLQIAVGLAVPTQQEWARGDIAPLVEGKPTPNGSIDVSDALVVLEKVVGVVTW